MTESWNLKSIDEIAEIGRGRSRHRPRNAPELYGGVYPFVQTADIHASDLYINTFSKTYNEAGLAQSKLWDSGVICITNAGENTGDCAILGIQACVPDSIITVIPDPEETDPVFLKYAIDQLKSQLRAVTKGATQDNLSIAKLTAFKFQVPSVATQKQIGHILRCYGDLIENNRRRIQLLERSLHLLYKEWFVHLRFPSHEHSKIVDGIPEGWRKCQISELGNIVTGKTPSKKDSDNFNGSIPFVKTPDLHNQIFVIKTEESLSERGLKTQSSKLIPRGSIMISCIGTVGIVSIASYPCQTNQQINSVVCSDNQYSYFTFFALSRLKPLLEAMGGGATMPNVNKTKFSSIQILLPPRSLILSFQESVEASFAQIEKLSIMSEKLKQARDLLLPKLMSGAISV